MTPPRHLLDGPALAALALVVILAGMAPGVAARIVCTHGPVDFETITGTWEREFGCDTTFDVIKVSAYNAIPPPGNGTALPLIGALFTACILDTNGTPTRCVTECGETFITHVPSDARLRLTLEPRGRLLCSNAAGFVSVYFAD